MITSTEPKKKISLTLNPDEYKTLTRFAENEKRKISNAARVIIVRFLRNYEK